MNHVQKTLVDSFFKTWFGLALKDGLLYYHYEIDGWLTVSYKNVEGSDGSKWKWSLLCAQSIEDYASLDQYSEEERYQLNTQALGQRITLMLADKLRSVQQDVNIEMYEQRK